MSSLGDFEAHCNVICNIEKAAGSVHLFLRPSDLFPSNTVSGPMYAICPIVPANFKETVSAAVLSEAATSLLMLGLHPKYLSWARCGADNLL